jgi:hypothetical protein
MLWYSSFPFLFQQFTNHLFIHKISLSIHYLILTFFKFVQPKRSKSTCSASAHDKSLTLLSDIITCCIRVKPHSLLFLRKIPHSLIRTVSSHPSTYIWRVLLGTLNFTLPIYTLTKIEKTKSVLPNYLFQWHYYIMVKEFECGLLWQHCLRKLPLGVSTKSNSQLFCNGKKCFEWRSGNLWVRVPWI